MAKKLWGGRFDDATHPLVEQFTSSLTDDHHLLEGDIRASIAHLHGLLQAGLVTKKESQQLEKSLLELQERFRKGLFQLNPALEDIHMNIEAWLIEKCGETGKKIHTGRSRNDQVVTAFKLTLRRQVDQLDKLLCQLHEVLILQAEKYLDVIFPGYTHLQKAQPVRLGHYFLAYHEMFGRDLDKLRFFRTYLLQMPLGAGALAGTPYAVDRHSVAEELGFTEPTRNSMDSVSDRDFVLDLLFSLSSIMLHFSRLSEDLIIWSSEEFQYVQLSDAFTTGSSIMPQKKNSDVCELTRGKSGRVVGSLMSAMMLMKGLPMSYNRDMQEDKHTLFDALQTVSQVLQVNTEMLRTIRINRERVAESVNSGYLLATDLADYLVGKGLAFRQAHEVVGQLVKQALVLNKSLRELSLNDMQKASTLFEVDVLERLSAVASADSRQTYGGTAREQVSEQIELAKARLSHWREG